MKPIIRGASFVLVMVPVASMAADMYVTDAYGLRPPAAQVLTHPHPARRVIIEQRQPVAAAPTRVIEHRVVEGPGYRTRTTRVTETAPAFGVGVQVVAPRPPRDVPFVAARAVGHPVGVRPVISTPHPLQGAVALDEDEDDFE